MTLGTKDAGITSVSTLTGASATAKTAVMPRGRKEPFFLAACKGSPGEKHLGVFRPNPSKANGENKTHGGTQ